MAIPRGLHVWLVSLVGSQRECVSFCFFPVDQAILKGDQAEKQVAVGGKGGHER